MYDIVTFGEILLRMAAPYNQRLEQSTWLNIGITGAEMNSCVTASRFGLHAAHITKLPKNALGRMSENKMREHGIDTSNIIWCDDGRLGLFYLEYGSMPRTNSVIYDRSNTTMSTIQPKEIDWDLIFKKTKHFHFCGTLPAISESSLKTTIEALSIAKKHGVVVSFDVNYRARLWSEEKALEVLSSLMEYVDLLITTEEDIYRVFKITGEDYEESAKMLFERFGFKAVVITLRENITVWRNNWTSIAYTENNFYSDVIYDLELVDRVGGGDAFTGGFLFAYLMFNGDMKKSLQYGNAAAALKQTNPGDLNWCTLEEVDNLIRRGNSKGMNLRIQR